MDNISLKREMWKIMDERKRELLMLCKEVKDNSKAFNALQDFLKEDYISSRKFGQEKNGTTIECEIEGTDTSENKKTLILYGSLEDKYDFLCAIFAFCLVKRYGLVLQGSARLFLANLREKIDFKILNKEEVSGCIFVKKGFEFEKEEKSELYEIAKENDLEVFSKENLISCGVVEEISMVSYKVFGVDGENFDNEEMLKSAKVFMGVIIDFLL